MTNVNNTEIKEQISVSKQKRLNKIFCILLTVSYLVYFVSTKPMYVISHIPVWGGIPVFWLFWIAGNIIACTLLGIWSYLKNKH